MEIYQPAEDTYLLADVLKKYFSENGVVSYLDMGTGSGFLSGIAKECDIKNILAVDINPDAIRLMKDKGFNAIQSDLFENIEGKFDIISFNAPYLPEDTREPKSSQVATTGGPKGDEVAAEFLKEAKRHLTKNGKIFLLVSSLTPMDKINEFGGKVIAKRRVFGEDLIVLEIGNN